MPELEANFSDNPASINALKVVRRLTSQGHEAYLVGGCVRDLLLDRSPKDFDVSTSALPEEVRELFRNSRSVGRRFKIVHVRFGRDIIEVATFRAPHSTSQSQANIADSGMILSDNVYGTFREDAIRRDFTMNALYYDADKDIIIDEMGGLEDISQARISLIGEPEERYREDPVRMLRAARFKAKLNFDIVESSAKPLKKLGFLLQDIPPARLFEEVLKLFMSGHGQTSLEALIEFDLFSWLFPETHQCLEDGFTRRLIDLALASTDERIAIEKTVTPAFVYAALLWSPFLKERERLLEEGHNSATASLNASGNVIARQQQYTSIPKRFSGPMRDIFHLQFRLPNRHGRKAESVLAHKRFRAAYDFLLLREAAGEELEGLGAWWTEFQTLQPDARQTSSQNRAKPRRRRKRKPRPPASQQ